MIVTIVHDETLEGGTSHTIHQNTMATALSKIVLI